MNICGHDFLSVPDDASVFCSEFVHYLLLEADVPVTHDQNGNEYTPKDIKNLEPYQSAKPIIFKFKNGKYRILKK